MRNLLLSVYVCLRAVLKERRNLSLENLALRQQLSVLKRSETRLKIKAAGSGVLDLAVTNLVWLARSADHRQTYDCSRLAS